MSMELIIHIRDEEGHPYFLKITGTFCCREFESRYSSSGKSMEGTYEIHPVSYSCPVKKGKKNDTGEFELECVLIIRPYNKLTKFLTHFSKRFMPYEIPVNYCPHCGDKITIKRVDLISKPVRD
jgi:hypothetical protein